jgi:hypothetical protein
MDKFFGIGQESTVWAKGEDQINVSGDFRIELKSDRLIAEPGQLTRDGRAGV